MAPKKPPSRLFEATKMAEDRNLRRFLAQTDGFGGISVEKRQMWLRRGSIFFLQGVASEQSFKNLSKDTNLPPGFLIATLAFKSH